MAALHYRGFRAIGVVGRQRIKKADLPVSVNRGINGAGVVVRTPTDLADVLLGDRAGERAALA